MRRLRVRWKGGRQFLSKCPPVLHQVLRSEKHFQKYNLGMEGNPLASVLESFSAKLRLFSVIQPLVNMGMGCWGGLKCYSLKSGSKVEDSDNAGWVVENDDITASSPRHIGLALSAIVQLISR